MSEGFANVLESPAVGLLVQLEHGGLQLAAVGDRLKVMPIARLTAEQRAELERYRKAILLLLRICEDAVQARREVFVEQLATAGASGARFVFRSRAVCALGACYSCGDLVNGHGCRCWRCALALRLALRAPIPSTFLIPRDQARVA